MPLRGELLSPEGLEERAKALAAVFMLEPASRADGHDVLPRLVANLRVLNAAYRSLADDTHRGVAVPPAAEWLLDNFHLVEAEARAARHDLPVRYYRKLPKLAGREFSGKARVHMMALELIRHGDGRLDAERLTRFVLAFQTVAPLTIGELWAWPSMLKLALLETLRLLADGIIAAAARQEADVALARLERGDTPPGALPDPLPSAFVASSGGGRASTTRASLPWLPRWRGLSPPDNARGGVRFRVPAPGHRSGLHQQHGDEPQAVRDAGLRRFVEQVSPMEVILRGPGRGIPADGLRQSDRYRRAVEDLAARAAKRRCELPCAPWRAPAGRRSIRESATRKRTSAIT